MAMLLSETFRRRKQGDYILDPYYLHLGQTGWWCLKAKYSGVCGLLICDDRLSRWYDLDGVDFITISLHDRSTPNRIKIDISDATRDRYWLLIDDENVPMDKDVVDILTAVLTKAGRTIGWVQIEY